MTQIKWLDWSKESFERAKKEDKPIILDIFGTWCYWCMRIEKDTYENPEVAELINENFVPVRVDTDKRPDINERYNQGGWPTTCFLTPAGEIIVGATYVPPQEMKKLLQQVIKFYKEKREELESISKAKSGVSALEERKFHVLDKTIIDNLVDYLYENFDTIYGGFYFAPKFPVPNAIELALLMHKKTGDKKLLKMAGLTLEGMLPLYDKVEGGFFRYSVTQDWSRPHYEKMLETNAEFLLNYLNAYEITQNNKFKETAAGIIDYVLTNLWSGSAFYGSQDADGEEEYYGKSLEERQKMEKPNIDKTIYVNLNSKAIIAFLEASRVLGNNDYKETALKAVDFILENCYDGISFCHYYDGKPNVYGLLTDNVHFAYALFYAYKATSDKKYLASAEKIISYLLRELKEDAFYDKAESMDDVGYLKRRLKPFTENCYAALLLLELHKISKNDSLKKAAEEVLSYFSEDYRAYGVHAAIYGIALQEFFGAE